MGKIYDSDKELRNGVEPPFTGENYGWGSYIQSRARLQTLTGGRYRARGAFERGELAVNDSVVAYNNSKVAVIRDKINRIITELGVPFAHNEANRSIVVFCGGTETPPENTSLLVVPCPRQRPESIPSNWTLRYYDGALAIFGFKKISGQPEQWQGFFQPITWYNGTVYNPSGLTLTEHLRQVSSQPQTYGFYYWDSLELLEEMAGTPMNPPGFELGDF